jgi:NAD(P)-dependent dehydrogenase (short-subunit alcohol dehydrogenase family)
MSRSLSNQTVMVFGGSSGIGAAVAELAHAEGAKVVAISRSGGAPDGVQGIAVDVGDRAGLAAVLKKVGVIDHLVHTVGARLGSPPLASLDEEMLPLAFETKLFSAIHAVRLALPYLATKASITFTSGQVSRKYGVGSLVKGTVNAAVDTAGRHLAKELAPRSQPGRRGHEPVGRTGIGSAHRHHRTGFGRAAGSARRRARGTGAGLPLCHDQRLRHGGRG